jgi:hypothetical protein
VSAATSGPLGSVDVRARVVRVIAVAVIWFGGLGAGFVGILAAVAQYGCGMNDSGFACKTPGSVCGILIVAASVAVVTAATLLTFERPLRRVLIVGAVGLGALVVLFVLGEVLLSTV